MHLSYETELYHHGIKGMHWGQRRFQNADGSLTSAGRARYAKDLTRRENKAAVRYIQQTFQKDVHKHDAQTFSDRINKRNAKAAAKGRQVGLIGRGLNAIDSHRQRSSERGAEIAAKRADEAYKELKNVRKEAKKDGNMRGDMTSYNQRISAYSFRSGKVQTAVLRGAPKRVYSDTRPKNVQELVESKAFKKAVERANKVPDPKEVGRANQEIGHLYKMPLKSRPADWQQRVDKAGKIMDAYTNTRIAAEVQFRKSISHLSPKEREEALMEYRKRLIH